MIILFFQLQDIPLDTSFSHFLFKFKCDLLDAATDHLFSYNSSRALDITFKPPLG